MEAVLKFLKENPVFYYATVDGDKPRVRPFGFYMELDGKFYVGMGNHKECYKQTAANPNIEICTADAQGRWIRIRAKAVEDSSDKTLEKAFEAMPSLKEIYNEKTGLKMACFYLEDVSAVIMDMKGNFEKVPF